jgi:hypothetical protein
MAAKPMSQGKETAWRFAVTKSYRNTLLLLALVTLLSALWPRYQAYRLHREVLEKAKLCRTNMAAVGMACRCYSQDFEHFPGKLSDIIPNHLESEPQCPFDESPYHAKEILVTSDNVNCFASGLIETQPGMLEVTVHCSSPLHKRFQPHLHPGYGSAAGFRQEWSDLNLEPSTLQGQPSEPPGWR